MALSADVTKIWPTINMSNEEYTISLQIALSDDGVLKQTEVFSVTVNKNDVLTNPQKVIDRLLVSANEWIDKYKKEKTAFNHAGYETIRAGVASGLVF